MEVQSISEERDEKPWSWGQKDVRVKICQNVSESSKELKSELDEPSVSEGRGIS